MIITFAESSFLLSPLPPRGRGVRVRGAGMGVQASFFPLKLDYLILSFSKTVTHEPLAQP